MRILFVSPSPPLPIRSGGQLAQYNVLRYLASREHRVHLLCLADDETDPATASKIREFCDAVEVFARPSGRITISLKQPHVPYAVASRLHPELLARMRTLCSSGAADVVHIENTTMGGYGLRGHVGIPISITIHSLMHLNFHRVARHARSWATKATFRLEALRMRRYERHIFGSRAFATYFFYSALDMRLALERFGDPLRRFRMLPLGIAADSLDAADGASRHPVGGVSESERVILLVGSMDNRSNEDAARWFAQAILPGIVRQLPEVRVLIVGRGSDEKLADLDFGRIRVVGEVDDLGPYLARADAYVVPQRGGAGIRVKLLDGLAAGKVVISTDVGVEAIPDIRDGEHYLLARDAAEFVQKCVGVLSDPDRFRSIAEAGRDFVASRYSIEAMGTEFERFLEECCGDTSQSTAFRDPRGS